MGRDEHGDYDGFDLSRRINKFEHRLERKFENRYIGFKPLLLLMVIALIIIYYYVFSSLGNNEDGSSSSIKVFVETVLWLLFIVLLLLNGISYIFGVDLLKSMDSTRIFLRTRIEADIHSTVFYRLKV